MIDEALVREKIQSAVRELLDLTSEDDRGGDFMKSFLEGRLHALLSLYGVDFYYASDLNAQPVKEKLNEIGVNL